MRTITVTTEYQGFWQLFEASWAGAIEVLDAVYEAGRTDEAMAIVAEYAEMVQESTGAPPSRRALPTVSATPTSRHMQRSYAEAFCLRS